MGASNSVEERPLVTYPSGNSYKGQWKGKSRHGRGVYTWVSGASYNGEWVDNSQEGHGVLSYPNNNRFEGNFWNNNPHGQGKLSMGNGRVIEGTWSFSGRDKRGSMIVPVGIYNLDVRVYDESNNSEVRYIGPATLYLKSGEVVLPGMSDQMAPIVSNVPDEAYAAAVFLTAIPVGGEQNIPIAAPIPSSVPMETAPFQPPNAPGTAAGYPVAAAATNVNTVAAFCPKCGTRNQENNTFCPNCGENLNV